MVVVKHIKNRLRDFTQGANQIQGRGGVGKSACFFGDVENLSKTFFEVFAYLLNSLRNRLRDFGQQSGHILRVVDRGEEIDEMGLQVMGKGVGGECGGGGGGRGRRERRGLGRVGEIWGV